MRRGRTRYSVTFPASRGGYTGRKCPNCCKYFKIMLGTGLEDIKKCYCPYCGCHEPHSSLHTTAQIEYARSVVINRVTRRLDSKLKRMARNINRRSRQSGGFLNITMDVKTARTRIRNPNESNLETYVECSSCTLKYAVYGVYAFCPDCGKHNAVQMLEDNLDISGRLIDLIASSDDVLTDKLISRSLADVVSSFDGFGRAVCKTYAYKSSNLLQAEKIRFQNLIGARNGIGQYFGFDLAGGLTQPEWEMVIRCFQKRHVLEHKSGVVDAEYVAKANDPHAIVGRKVSLTEEEVRSLIKMVGKLGTHIFSELDQLP